MSDRELYQQKMRAKLDGWKADIDKLRARAADRSADVQLEIKDRLKKLEGRLAEGRAHLAELASAGEDAWETFKERAESAWSSVRSSLDEIAAKLK